MRRTRLVLVLVVALLGASSAQAQEILLTGPLKGAPVGRHLWRERRPEIAAASGVRLSHGASPSVSLLGEVRYYPLDRLGLGTWGAVALSFGHGCSSVCTILAVPEVAVLPFVGRSQWLGYLPYDVHLIAAPAWVWQGGGERPGSYLAASIGGGVRGFWASSFSTTFDYRALLGSDVAHMVSLSISWWPTDRHWDYE